MPLCRVNVTVPTFTALDQSSSKTGKPSTDDLLLLAFELGTSWKMLGRTLALPEPVLEQIEVDNRYLSEKCYGVLRRWTEVFGSAATYESLARALQHPIVGRGELAVKYCDVCRDVYQGKKRTFDSAEKALTNDKVTIFIITIPLPCFIMSPASLARKVNQILRCGHPSGQGNGIVGFSPVFRNENARLYAL